MSNKKAKNKNKNKKRRERERERERQRGKKRKRKMLLAASKKCSLPSYLAVESFNGLSYKNFVGKKNLVSQQSQVCRISFWLVTSFFVKTNSTPTYLLL